MDSIEPARYLITTADERTWKNDRPILFLGDWCTLYSREAFWAELDSAMVPYHWADRAKFRGDYDYLDRLYEELLPKVAARLNDLHAVDHSNRYWRILAGPWLAYFIQIVFDRWSSIDRAVNTFDISGTTALVGCEKEMVPNDMDHFYDLIPSELWNHHVFAAIVREATAIPVTDVKCDPPVRRKKTRRPRFALLKRIYKMVAPKFVRDRDALFVATYLSNAELIRLHLRFGQVPQYISPADPVQVDVDWSRREWEIDYIAENEFETCLRKLIPRQIPRLFVEGYHDLLSQTAGLQWPAHPKALFTSNAIWFDTVAMAYIAEKIERQTPLFCGQHGGVYGVAEFSAAEDHELAIADRYLTWGWANPADRKLVPVGMLKPRYPRQPRSRSSLVLVGISTFSRYSYIVTSESSIDFGNYIDRCFAFTASLRDTIKDNLLVRLTARDVGWSQEARWRDRFPDVRIDAGAASMSELMANARLVVCTYNSTNFLEAIASDIPTVLFCDFDESPLRDSAKPFFSDLAAAGIVHSSAESAARHVGAVWDDVDAWWHRRDVRESLSRFRHQFCREPKSVISQLEHVMRAEIRA